MHRRKCHLLSRMELDNEGGDALGRNSHYYVRKGKLSEGFECAFERALDKAVESIARMMGLETHVLSTNPYAVLEDSEHEETASAPESFEN